jgi:hypothetical protein
VNTNLPPLRLAQKGVTRVSELVNGSDGESKCLSESFVTPVKKTEGSGFSDCLSTLSSSASILDDDDFNESILEEIDAICEQKSVLKVEKESPNRSFSVECECDQGNEGSLASLESGMRDVLDSPTEEKSICPCGNMPEEYVKYLQGLNDRQREAACSDISVPLMLIAGPGSGKVSHSLPICVCACA